MRNRESAMIAGIPGDLIQRLRGSHSVAGKGSVTRAAVAMRRRQPAVTYPIKCLERELGVTLFDRPLGGMTLTLEGREVSGKVLALILFIIRCIEHLIFCLLKF
jgi:DNA-binding transcriptional LysR family regulator